MFWLLVLIISLSLLYFNLKSHNLNTYCLVKIEDKWFYGQKSSAIYFYTSADEVKDIKHIFDSIESNYDPTFEEIINNTNKKLLICKLGNWKNETNTHN